MREKLCFAISQWNLAEIEVIYENDYKAVYSAISEKYGPVILKLNRNTSQLREEYTMLHKLDGNGCCKIYAYDEMRGIMLEERIVPGTVLREEECLRKRIEVFKTVFSQIHHEEAGQASAKESETVDAQTQIYTDWLQDGYLFCVENDVDAKLLKMAKQARDFCMEMFHKYPERLLLHGDLHHDNILLREDGTYAMIDPKGVIGPKILDLPRYIMNEIDTKHTASDEEHMRDAVRLVSEMCGYSIEDVTKLYFMEVILGNLWCLEDGEEMNEEEIEIAAKILETVSILS